MYPSPIMSPAGFPGTAGQSKVQSILVYDHLTPIQVGDGEFGLAVPPAFAGLKLTRVSARVYSLGVTGSTLLQIRRRRGASNTDLVIGGAGAPIGADYLTSFTNLLDEAVQAGDVLIPDIDGVHTTPPYGLTVIYEFTS